MNRSNINTLNDVIIAIAKFILPNSFLLFILPIDRRRLDIRTIEFLRQIHFFIKTIEKEEQELQKYEDSDVDMLDDCADLTRSKEELKNMIMKAQKLEAIQETYEFVGIFSEVEEDVYIKKLAFYVDEEETIKYIDIYKIFRSIAVSNDTWYSSKVVSTFTTYKRFINSLIAVYTGLFASTLFSDNNFHNLYFLTVDHIILGFLAVTITIYVFYSWSFNVGEINSAQTRESPEHCSRVELIANDYILKSRPYITFLAVIMLNLIGVFEYVVGFNPHKTTICSDGQLIDELIPYQEFYQCDDMIFIQHIIDGIGNITNMMIG